MRAFKIILTSVAIIGIGVLFYRSRSDTISQKNLVNTIYAVFDEYRIPYDLDAHSVDASVSEKPLAISGIDEFKKQIARYVDKSDVIQIILVGFPFKSANTEQKVFGYLPDMAERKSLQYLQSLLNDIRKVYEPGARITIFCDGIPFAPYLGIPLAHVSAYEDGLKKLCADLPDIQLFTSDDFMKMRNLKNSAAINEFIDAYPPSDEEFRKLGPLSPVTLQRIAIELDHAAGKKLLEKQSLESIVFSIVSREARMRNYILEQFPPSQYIRFTVHFSPDISKKFGVRLSPDSAVTPYHGVCVEYADKTWAITFKKDVNTQQCRETSTIVNEVLCPFYMCEK